MRDQIGLDGPVARDEYDLEPTAETYQLPPPRARTPGATSTEAAVQERSATSGWWQTAGLIGLGLLAALAVPLLGTVGISAVFVPLLAGAAGGAAVVGLGRLAVSAGLPLLAEV